MSLLKKPYVAYNMLLNPSTVDEWNTIAFTLMVESWEEYLKD
jgi:hypothetical protein